MLEKMTDFFTERVEQYDAHMLANVPACAEAYREMAQLIPKKCHELLDLGCGTGLELAEVFNLYPDIHVTGIDLTQAMLDKLKQKYADKQINLICGRYFDVDFGKDTFDCVISFQTMHHFSHEKKIGLYNKIQSCLKKTGMYIECDYMVEAQEDEDFYYAENQRIRKEMNIPENAFYHYDTPCTVHNQIEVLKKAGFSEIVQKFRMENTTILCAYRQEISGNGSIQ